LMVYIDLKCILYITFYNNNEKKKYTFSYMLYYNPNALKEYELKFFNAIIFSSGYLKEFLYNLLLIYADQFLKLLYNFGVSSITNISLFIDLLLLLYQSKIKMILHVTMILMIIFCRHSTFISFQNNSLVGTTDKILTICFGRSLGTMCYSLDQGCLPKKIKDPRFKLNSNLEFSKLMSTAYINDSIMLKIDLVPCKLLVLKFDLILIIIQQIGCMRACFTYSLKQVVCIVIFPKMKAMINHEMNIEFTLKIGSVHKRLKKKKTISTKVNHEFLVDVEIYSCEKLVYISIFVNRTPYSHHMMSLSYTRMISTRLILILKYTYYKIELWQYFWGLFKNVDIFTISKRYNERIFTLEQRFSTFLYSLTQFENFYVLPDYFFAFFFGRFSSRTIYELATYHRLSLPLTSG
ncbi:hypothetical protein AGLY_017738, partial [Aphis glycines]